MKESVFNACISVLASRIDSSLAVLTDLRESAANETKSSVGDKYETALAMLQIEQRNVSQQLEVLQGQMAMLRSLGLVGPSAVIIPGSLVEMNSLFYYLSVALGKVNVAGIDIIALSPSSPLGRLMMGRAAGNVIVFQGRSFSVQRID